MLSTVDRTLESLLAALQHELRLIDELRQALLRQRAGVAADDTAEVEASVQAIGRTLFTLEEARRRRTTLTEHLTGGRGSALDELEQHLGALPPVLAELRERVRSAAQTVASDVAINQTVLRRALDAGDAYLQQLFSGAIDPAPVYVSTARPEPAARSGLLLNRRA